MKKLALVIPHCSWRRCSLRRHHSRRNNDNSRSVQAAKQIHRHSQIPGVIFQELMTATFCNVPTSPNTGGYGSGAGAASTSTGITTPVSGYSDLRGMSVGQRTMQLTRKRRAQRAAAGQRAAPLGKWCSRRRLILRPFLQLRQLGHFDGGAPRFVAREQIGRCWPP